MVPAILAAMVAGGWTMKSPSDRIQEDFDVFHRENPHVFQFFDLFARQMMARGFTHGSAKLILERIRWELHVEQQSDKPPKLNNNYSSRYARLWEDTFPEYRGFFRKRKLNPISANSTSRVSPEFQEG